MKSIVNAIFAFLPHFLKIVAFLQHANNALESLHLLVKIYVERKL